MAADPPSPPVVPCSDSSDDDISFLTEVYLMLDDVPSLNLADAPLLIRPNGVEATNPVLINPVAVPCSEFRCESSQGQGFLQPDNLGFANPVASCEFRGESSQGQGFLQPDNLGYTHPVPGCEFHCESSQGQEFLQPDNSGFGNPVQLPIWPVPVPVQYACSGCLILREIIHVKGNHMTRLEIHGVVGLICHAILENQLFLADWTMQSQCHQMIDFCKKSIEGVKEYLEEYCAGRKQDGYKMQKDPFAGFYEALCVGLSNGDDDDLDTDDFLQPSSTNLQPSSTNADENQANQPQPLNQIVATGDEVRRSLAEQRARTANLTLKDFIDYFHLPIEDAAKTMKVCPTVVKKISRKQGLKRWPHRKIKSLEKKISNRRRILNGNNAEERDRAQQELESFQQELASIFAIAMD